MNRILKFAVTGIVSLLLPAPGEAQTFVKGWGRTSSTAASTARRSSRSPRAIGTRWRDERRLVVAWGENSSASATSRCFRPDSPTSRSLRDRATRWRAGATAPSSRGGTTITASATSRHSQPASPTSRSRRARLTPLRGGATAPSLVGEQHLRPMDRGRSTSPCFQPGSRTLRLRRVAITRWRSGATAPSLRGDGIPGATNVPMLPAGLSISGSRPAPLTRWRAAATDPLSRGETTSGTAPPLPAGLTYVQVAGGGGHSLALRSDGSVFAWGDNSYGEGSVPALSRRAHYVGITAGYEHRWRDAATDRSRLGSEPEQAVQRSPARCRRHRARSHYGRQHERHLFHRGASQRRLRRCVGRQPLRRVRRPCAAAGVTFVEIDAHEFHTVARLSDATVTAGAAHGFGQCFPCRPARSRRRGRSGRQPRPRPPERCIGSAGDTTPRPVQRPALPPGSPTSRSRRAPITRWCAGATALSLRSGRTPPASATFPRSRPDSPTSRSRRETVTRWRAGATARSSHGDTTLRPVNVPAASGRTHVRRDRGGRRIHGRRCRSDGAVVAWGNNATASATFPRSPPATRTSTSPRAPSRRRTLRTRRRGRGRRVRVRRRRDAAFSCSAPRLGQIVNFSLAQGTPNAAGFSVRQRRARGPAPLAIRVSRRGRSRQPRIRCCRYSSARPARGERSFPCRPIRTRRAARRDADRALRHRGARLASTSATA